MGKAGGGFTNTVKQVSDNAGAAAQATASPMIYRNPKKLAGMYGDVPQAAYQGAGARENVNGVLGDNTENYIVNHQKEGWLAAGLLTGAGTGGAAEGAMFVPGAFAGTAGTLAVGDAAGDTLIRKPKAEAAAAAEADAAQKAADDAALQAAIIPPSVAPDARRKRVADGRAGTILTGAGSGSGTGTTLGGSGGRSTSLGL